MVRINLLPPEERVDRNRQALERLRENAPYLVALTAALAFGVMGGLQELAIKTTAAQVRDLEAEANTILPQLAKVQKLEAEKKELIRRLDVIRALDRE